MEADEDLAQRVKDAGGPKAALALLKIEGFEMTQQELREAFLARNGKELSDEQLDAIVGGVDPEYLPDIILGGAALGGAAIYTVGYLAGAAALV